MKFHRKNFTLLISQIIGRGTVTRSSLIDKKIVQEIDQKLKIMPALSDRSMQGCF